ncbi:hypothetical protein [Sphingobacterium yanglingense]|uniref:Uncharacterized protein n=1 Tax=Sphingobacterium yanglingense TaxID=1437280 RepID=A0A4R6WF12_9SPHI|nr:hypothetical protein [Sphingobacterium yanglingense]TDQ76587.1 hypothetical protein CLV99_3180 [Sphingobacterium yanglingense]
MNHLLTDNSTALQALMSETIFSTGFSIDNVERRSEESSDAVAFDSSSEEFVFQGDKSTGVLFILRYPEFPYFSPQAEEAFIKTIGALQLTPHNVAVVNLANPQNPNEFKRIMEFFKPTKITLLGVEPASLKLPEIAHNSYMRGRVATVFNTFSFEEMFADVEKKKLFWGEFKTFING